MNSTTENANDSTTDIIVFDLIPLSSRYNLEQNIVKTFVVILSLIGILVNGLFLVVIIKDPFKQLRTITAILLAFNSVTNLILTCVSFVENLVNWFDGTLSQELIFYVKTVSSFLYIFGNLFHTINTYGAIVVPVRYMIVAPKIRKYLVQSLTLATLVTFLVVAIPVSVLPKSKQQDLATAVITIMCALIVILSITFAIIYYRIFRSLYAKSDKVTWTLRRRKLCTVNMKHSVDYRNQRIAMTLFVHVVFFTLTAVPGPVIFLIFLHHGSSDALSLAALFSKPLSYLPLVFLPLLWLFRLKTYNRGMLKILCLWRGEKSEEKTQLNAYHQTQNASQDQTVSQKI